MKNKIYLTDYVLSYQNVCNYLYSIINNPKYKSKIIRDTASPIGYTTFNYPIDCYKIGYGKRHVLLLGDTHGCEIVTTYFLLEFILTILNDDELYEKYSKYYTFHIIPILNPEGYIISTSNVCQNVKGLTTTEFEELAKEYLKKYNLDDEIAKKNIKANKEHRNVLKTSTEYIPDEKLRKNVERILKNCNLSSSVLPTWSANGMGIDLNRNSIHNFKQAKKLANKKKFANLRYNDIPTTKPSPIGYPGDFPFDTRCPENLALHKYINSLYNLNYTTTDEKFIAIFSFHSTGGEIYSSPDKDHATNNKIACYAGVMKKYSSYTGYEIMDEEIKYGIMDYYRISLKKVYALTIELSKLNGNPIGPFANINSLLSEIQNNKIAILNTLIYISKL